MKSRDDRATRGILGAQVRASPLVEDMKRHIDFLGRHSPAHHLKESEAI